MQNLDWPNSIHPLPVRIIPCPWEDLASILSRSAQEMGYQTVLWLLRPEVIPHRVAREVCRLRKALSYQVLERLLLLSEERLYSMTFHRFATRLQAPEEAFLTGKVEEIQRPLLSRNTYQRYITSH